MVSELVFFFCFYINIYKKKNYRLQYVGYKSIVKLPISLNVQLIVKERGGGGGLIYQTH